MSSIPALPITQISSPSPNRYVLRDLGMVPTVPVGPVNINYYPSSDPFFGTIAPLFDRIDIMTYDMEAFADKRSTGKKRVVRPQVMASDEKPH